MRAFLRIFDCRTRGIRRAKGRLLGFARFRPERNSIVRIEVAIGESPGKMVAGPSGKILSSALSLSRDKLKRAFSSLIRVLRQPPCVPFFQPLCPAELTLPPSRFSREETTRSSPLHRYFVIRFFSFYILSNENCTSRDSTFRSLLNLKRSCD